MLGSVLGDIYANKGPTRNTVMTMAVCRALMNTQVYGYIGLAEEVQKQVEIWQDKYPQFNYQFGEQPMAVGWVCGCGLIAKDIYQGQELTKQVVTAITDNEDSLKEALAFTSMLVMERKGLEHESRKQMDEYISENFFDLKACSGNCVVNVIKRFLKLKEKWLSPKEFELRIKKTLTHSENDFIFTNLFCALLEADVYRKFNQKIIDHCVSKLPWDMLDTYNEFFEYEQTCLLKMDYLKTSPEQIYRIGTHNVDLKERGEYTECLDLQGLWNGLIKAAYNCPDPKIIQALIDVGYKTECKNDCGQTALHMALLKNSVEIVELLYKQTKPLIENLQPATALETSYYGYACYGNDSLAKIKKLADLGEPVDIVYENDSFGKTGLFTAVYLDKVEEAKLLIKLGADINHTDDYGNTPLLFCQSQKMFDMLIENGAKFPKSKSLIIRALKCAEHWSFLFNYLIQQGYSVDEKDDFGNTPLMYLCSQMQFNKKEGKKIFKKLVQCADVNIRNNKDETALMIAASRCSLKEVQKLVDAGADVNVVDSSGKNILMYMLEKYDRKTDFNIVRYFIEEKNIDLSKLDNLGYGIDFYVHQWIKDLRCYHLSKSKIKQKTETILQIIKDRKI